MYSGKKTSNNNNKKNKNPDILTHPCPYPFLSHSLLLSLTRTFLSSSGLPTTELPGTQQRVNQNIPNINKCNIITIIIVVVIYICQRRQGGARSRQLAGQLHSEPLEVSKCCADQARNRYWHKAEQRASGIWLWRTTCYRRTDVLEHACSLEAVPGCRTLC